MIHLATFSDSQMSRSRALCIESALKHGVDRIAGPHYFDRGLETRDGFTLEWLKSEGIYGYVGEAFWQNRGCGFWLWKPYVIHQTMTVLQDGDVVVYADAGIEFIDNANYIIDRMDQHIFLFGNNWEHAHWCKADVIEAVCPPPLGKPYFRIRWEDFGKQCQASVIFFRVSDYSRKFVAEWLKWCLHRERFSTVCTDEWRYLIDDSPSRLPNHPEFREHRHDQAILTTLAYREGIRLHYWPSVYNRGGSPEFVYEKLTEYAGDTYPVLFHHHRRRNHEWSNAA